MPSRNIVKEYIESGYYHIYNRGVEKRDIFLDAQDYSVFLNYLKEYLSDEKKENLKAKRNGYLCRNIAEEVDLLAFCLMPNHFHLLVRQHNERAIATLMRCLSTRYSMYFNRKYERTGHLFQGIYKAVLIKSDEQLIHLSRYIHLNPSEVVKNYTNYDYSSYDYYTKGKKADWVKVDPILQHFDNTNKYKKFIMNQDLNSEEFVGILSLEDLHKVEPCARGEDG